MAWRCSRPRPDFATAVLEAVGLIVSDVFRLMMLRIVAGQGLAFDPLVPNAKTIQAMKAARKGGLKPFKSVDALMAGLIAVD